MKTIEQQLTRYKSVHLDSRNIKTHIIGIPLIIWAVLILLACIPLQVTLLTMSVNVASLFVFLVLIYYACLHKRLALGMFIAIMPLLVSAKWLSELSYGLESAIGMFVIGWLFQGLGHKFEGAKPAFIDDLNQLLIGPIFLMAEFYFALGWEPKLLADITPKAHALRAELDANKQAKA
ncbi:DUF962 domain-containing protein [Shewanella sp. SNU WT4]|uniref:Mpo1 family 2-hydroxy fatty acid dioxygenase n=1 Tax=Shewanella sp. SNU WT4 TaxID=2590015 RepID=UPI00112B99A0|nr:Mpo1-like protein [Shewanella sp. SNU WT4]QDF66318.1 DUF962 domain-containing protein [Shewanella sp. SNU WT4]